MEACIVICRSAKTKARKSRILFINAVNEVTRERAQSFLTDDHIERIVKAYENFKDEPGFTRVAKLEEIRAKDCNLSILLYVAPASVNVGNEATAPTTTPPRLPEVLSSWLQSSGRVHAALDNLLTTIPARRRPR